MKKRVAVAMSGGVDSSTSLALLVEEGYDCIGVAMQLWDYSSREDSAGAMEGSCCTLDDIRDARRVADALNVPFYVLNMEEVFTKEVVEYFIAGYRSGATPNPCIKCNQVLKFDTLLKKAIGFEADLLATGHYARVADAPWGRRLLKGADPLKDQSYFLFTMTQAQLGRVIFPVGSLTKEEVRRKARAMGLRTSEKEESQEICFVEEPSYTGFLASRIGEARGEIVDTTGKVLGAHNGSFNYTIGQRKGLNLSGGPHYVIAIDPAANRVVVGPEELLYSSRLAASGCNWIDPEAQEEAARGLSGVAAKIRYRHAASPCTVRCRDGRMEVEFSEPQRAAAPGQAIVIYRGDEVLGGGWIEAARA